MCTAVEEANNKNINISTKYVSGPDFSYRNRTVKGVGQRRIFITRCYFRCLSYAIFTHGSLPKVWTLLPQTTPTTTKILESLITPRE